MMRPLLHFIFSLSLLANSFCQVNQISLQDGSNLKGIVETITADSTVKIRLQDSTILEIPLGLVWQVSKNRKDFQHLPGSNAKVLRRGRYSNISAHVLTAKKLADDFGDGEELRWGMGFHFSTGYQFNPALAVGGGFGLDMPEDLFTPVFAEVRGAFFRKTPSFRQVKEKQKQKVRWMGGYFEIEDEPASAPGQVISVPKKQRIAFCYAVQAGVFFPWKEVFNDNQQTQNKLGLLLYPALGLTFPSAGSTTFQIDFGYKFQRHTVHSTSSINTVQVIETFHLNSLAMRAGWTF